MNKAKEISALWKQIKPQVGELARLCREVESHAEVTADAYQRGYEAGLNDEKEGVATCQYCKYEYLDETEEPCKKCCKAYMNKYKPKAKEEQIQVGDEVIPKETEYDTMIATRLWKDDYDSDCIDAIGFDGRISSFLVSRVSKTGKHYEIAEVFAKMKETDL